MSSNRFPCFCCPLTFEARQALNLHFKGVHMATRKERLKRCCGLTFTNAVALRFHRWKVHGEQAWVCLVCGVGYKKKHMLEVHMGTTHVPEPFMHCHYCGLTFQRQDRVSPHRRKCQEFKIEGRFRCGLCLASFVSRDELKDHRQAAHVVECPTCNKSCANRAQLAAHCMFKHGHRFETNIGF